MAITRLTIDGFGQLELNMVTFPRTGQIVAQCAFASNFVAAAPAEVGMLLAVDEANRKVQLPIEAEVLPVAINYSTEVLYNQFEKGLKNFHQVTGETYPRLGYLSTGDKFTTNCLCADIGGGADYANEAAVLAALADYKTTPVFGGISTLGAIRIVATKPTVGPALKVIEYTTMADGQKAVKFQAL